MNEANLRKLATYLLSGKLKARFTMGKFDEPCVGSFTTCGTAGCAIGHGPYAGIERILGEKWGSYCNRAFVNIPDNFGTWEWCFASYWKAIDNTPEGAGKRILWLLDKGLPENCHRQIVGLDPLCYMEKS